MPTTDFFWLGGRKIEIEKDDSAVTIQAASTADAREAARRAGLELQAATAIAPGLVRASVSADPDSAVDRLRAGDNVVHHVYRDRGSREGEYLITESFFIKFKPLTPDERILQYLSAEHLVVERELGDKTYLVRVTNDTGRNPIRAANAANTREDVEYAEPNLVRPLTKFVFIPPDPLFSQQWHLHAPADAVDLVVGAGIFAPEAWDITRGRRDIVVAVADDGFDLTHPDFQGDGKIVARLNATVRGNGSTHGIDWDDDVSPRPGDYHGTPCLGVAVAEGNGTGVVGVAPGCSLVGVRFPLGEMTDAHFIAMFRKISSLADIVSCSWGYGPANAPMSSALTEAITDLAQAGGRRGKGLIFCVAAGNNNCPIRDLDNTQPYRYTDQSGIIRSYSGPIDRWIAAHDAVLTVSATTSNKGRAAYSSWGKEVCVCAPSDNWDDLGQTTPPGLGITTTDNEGFGPRSDFTPNSRFTDSFGGTSSATPTVAGVCALVLSVNPQLTGAQVRDILQASADKDLSLQSDTPVNKPGVFDGNGFSHWFGHGKVNASRAVHAANADSSGERLVGAQVTPAVAIPDAGAWVVSAIDIADDGRISDFRVLVNIKHTFISDLRVDLVTPAGTSVVLHNHSGGSGDDLIRTYSTSDTPSLQPLRDSSIRGRWQLRVRDVAALDTGHLNEWRIAARVKG
jgi:subtilisin family serine protease